jgi:hypothetical protein
MGKAAFKEEGATPSSVPFFASVAGDVLVAAGCRMSEISLTGPTVAVVTLRAITAVVAIDFSSLPFCATVILSGSTTVVSTTPATGTVAS